MTESEFGEMYRDANDGWVCPSPRCECEAESEAELVYHLLVAQLTE